MKKSALLIILVTAAAQAQDDGESESAPRMEIMNKSHTITEEVTDWDHASNDAWSQVGMSNTKRPGKVKVMRSRTDIRQVIDLEPHPRATLCESGIDLEYYQRDTEADVRTTFTSANCDSFDASYQLHITYFDRQGKFQRIVSDERWPDDMNGPYKKSFQLEPESKLKRVTARNLKCVCSDD